MSGIEDDIAAQPGQPDGGQAVPVADQTLDITGEICPMTFVRTRLALDRLASGAVLLVRMRGDEPVRNVPRTALSLGHSVLRMQTDPGGVTGLWLRRK